MREPIAHFDPALSVGFESDLERIQGVALVAVAVGNHQAFDREFLWVLGIGKGCFGDGFAGVFGKHRFGVEAFHVANTTVHKEPDDAFDFGWEVGFAVGG